MAEAITTTAAEQKISSNSETIECPICLQKVNNPKYLPCLHTFCESCLQTHITNVTQTEKALLYFECPVCRQTVEPPEQGRPISEWARLFPTNKLIETLIHVNPPKENSEINCMVCERQEKQTKAKFKCVECTESLCEDCKRCHDSFRFSRNHRTITLEGREPEENIMCLPDQESCSRHKGKYMERYCYDHEQVCCIICIGTEHRQCENVKDIDEVKSQIKREIVEYDLTLLLAMISKIDDFIAVQEEKLTNLNAKRDQITESLSAKIAEMKSLFDKLHTLFSKAFNIEHENVVYSIEQCIRDLKGLKTSMQNATKVFKIVLQRGSENELFISIAKLVQQQLHHFGRFRKANETDFDKDYQYNFENLLQQISEKGRINEITIKKQKSEIVRDLSEALPKLCILRKEFPKPAPWICELNVDSLQLQAVELHCSYLLCSQKSLNSCFLDENNIIVSCEDKLLIYGIDGEQKDDITLPELENKHGYGQNKLAYVQNGQYSDEVILSIGTKAKTYKIRKGKEPVLMNEIDLHENVDGFCVLKDVIVSVTTWTVKIYRYTPDVSTVFSTTEYRSADIGYVAASKTKERFAYATHKEVVCRKSDGTEIFRYSHENLKSPRGVAFDYFENIYVCTTFFNSTRQMGRTRETGGGVIQVMNDGSTGRIFISDYRNACLIHFCSNGELFFLSDGSRYTFYKLSHVQSAK